MKLGTATYARDAEAIVRGCVGKARYSSWEFARGVADRRMGVAYRRGQGVPSLRIYRCDNCQGWHMSSRGGQPALCGSCLGPFTPNGDEWQCEECR